MEFLPLLLIFAIMLLPMMLISRRQRRMQREQQELVSQLGVGDEVRTHSGFYGLIVEEYDDVVILESEDGTQTKWARQAVSGKVELADPSELLEDAAEDADASAAEDSGESIPGVTVRDEDRTRGDDNRDR